MLTSHSGWRTKDRDTITVFTLQSKPTLLIDHHLCQLLTDAERGLIAVDRATVDLDFIHLRQLFRFYAEREAAFVEAIEAMRLRLALPLSDEPEASARRRRISEAAAFADALEHGVELQKDNASLLDIILLLHRLGAPNEPKAGSFRTTQNWVGKEGSSLNEAVFIPPPPNELFNQLTELANFIDCNDENIPAVLRTAVGFVAFLHIHPFEDGNGRTARLLTTLLLYRYRVLHWPCLYLSYFTTKYRDEYYRCLDRYHQYGEIEGWVRFFLRMIAEASIDTIETLDSLHRRRING
ncbi:hypothetical protein CCP3SC1_1010009 [Gammaproteobacteria bacterium]